jgi:MFS family permease
VLLSRPLLALAAAEVVSSLGSLMTVVALPWFVLASGGSPSRMGLTLAAEAAPLALFGLPSARIAGRLGARRSLLVCDAIWAPSVAAIPLLHFAGLLSFPLLLALAFVAGVPWAAHYGSQSALLPEFAGEDATDLTRVSAVFQTLARATYFIGPVIGGLLIAWLGAPAVLLIDAASFAVSFAIVTTWVKPTSVGRPAPEAGSSLGASGLTVIRRDRVLRPITAAQALSQAAFMAMTATVPVLAFDAYDRNPSVAGILIGAWGGGAMLGGMAAYRLVEWHPPLTLGAVAWVLQALPLWLMAAAPSLAVALAALAISGLGNGVRVPAIIGVTTSRIPPPLRAQTLTTATAITLGAGFLCLILAGPALDRFGAANLFAAIAALQTAAALLVIRLALRHPKVGLTVEAAGLPE